jgi:hypothetical protein
MYYVKKVFGGFVLSLIEDDNKEEELLDIALGWG